MDRSLTKNILSLGLIQGANILIPLLTLPYLVRVLGPTQYGRLGFAVAFVQYFVLLTDFGFNLSATRAIAASREDQRSVSRIFWNVVAAKAILSIFGFLCLVLLTLTVEKLERDRTILLVSYLAVFGTVLFPVWLYQGLERMGTVAIANLAARALLVPLIFLLVHSPGDVQISALLQSGTALVAGIVAVVIIRQRRLVSWVAPSFSGILSAMRESHPLFLSSAAISLYTNSTTVLLGFFASEQVVGRFVAVDKVRQALQAVINPISQAFYPRICALIEQAPQKAYRLMRSALALQGGVTLLLSLGLLLFAEPIVAVGLGPQYLEAETTLRILAMLPFIIGVSNVFGIQVLLPLGMNTAFRNVIISCGIVNLLILIPLALLYGDKGAAAAILITESLITVAMGAIIIRTGIPILASRRPAREP